MRGCLYKNWSLVAGGCWLLVGGWWVLTRVFFGTVFGNVVAAVEFLCGGGRVEDRWAKGWRIKCKGF